MPTGVLAANQAYFLIAALAWNLKTWMLNLFARWRRGGAALQALSVSVDLPSGGGGQTGRDTVVLKLPPGEYYQRFRTALAPVAAL